MTSIPQPKPPLAGLLTQRLLALFFGGWVLLNFPLLKLALGSAPTATLLGLPRLPMLLFGAWAGLIVLLAFLMERGSRSNEGGVEEPPHPLPATAAGGH